MFGAPRNMIRRLRSKVRVRELASLKSSVLDQVRNDPNSIRDAYSACGEEWNSVLRSNFNHLTTEEREFAFCSVMAHSLAPFGSDNTCITFPELVRQSSLNCGNYGLLAYYLARTLMADYENAGR